MSRRSEKGFSLVECVFALMLLMIGSMALISVLAFATKSNGDARKRYAALMLAERRLEDIRNTPFQSLTAGTITENDVVQDGVVFQVVRTIVDNDLNTNSLAPGPEMKTISIRVTPRAGHLTNDRVEMTTYRMVTRPGPNRVPNP